MTTPIHQRAGLSGFESPSPGSSGDLSRLLDRCHQALQAGDQIGAQRAWEALGQLRREHQALEQQEQGRWSWSQQECADRLIRFLDLWLGMIRALEDPAWVDWCTGPGCTWLAEWTGDLQQRASEGLLQLRPEQRGQVLFQLSERLQDHWNFLATWAAQLESRGADLRSPGLGRVVEHAFEAFQGIAKAVRGSIKELCSPDDEQSPFHANRLKRTGWMVGLGFFSVLLIRITSVLLGTASLADEEEPQEGLDSLSISRFAFATANLGATYLFHRVGQRRAHLLDLHGQLVKARTTLKQALFQAQQWRAALEALQSLQSTQQGGRLLNPAHLQAGLTALERLHTQPPEAESAEAMERGGPLAVSVMPTLSLDAWVHIEHEVGLHRLAVEALLDPLRDAMQACARLCDQLPEAAQAAPGGMATLESCLQQQLIELQQLLLQSVQLSQRAQALQAAVDRYEARFCGQRAPALLHHVAAWSDSLFAFSSWLMGGVESFAPLQADLAKRILWAGAILDAINSATTPLREAAISYSASAQRVKLDLLEGITAVEGIRPLGEAAFRAFLHILDALHSAAGGQRQEHLRQQHALEIACEVSRVTMALVELPLGDPNRAELEQILALRAVHLQQILPAHILAGYNPCPDSWSPDQDPDMAGVGASLTAALAEATLLPDEIAGPSRRPLPHLRRQLQQAAQRAEESCMQSVSPFRPSVSGLSSGPPRRGMAGLSPSGHPLDASAALRQERPFEPLHGSGGPWTGRRSESSGGSQSVEVGSSRSSQEDRHFDSLERPEAPVAEDSPASQGSSERVLPAGDAVELRQVVVEGALQREDAFCPSASRRHPGVVSAMARSRWELLRLHRRLAFARVYLNSDSWRHPVEEPQRGLRLWRVMRACLILSAHRALERLQLRFSSGPWPLATARATR